MSDKPEKPASVPINFNLQGSISFGEKPKPPPPPSPIEIIFKVVIPISFCFYLIFAIRPPTPTPTPEKSPLTGRDLGIKEYTVLVGSFKTPEQAKVVASQLRTARINNFIVQGQGKWHVCVGKYSSAKRANSTLENLKNRGWTEAVVLPPKS